jgi:hypothetical protein
MKSDQNPSLNREMHSTGLTRTLADSEEKLKNEASNCEMSSFRKYAPFTYDYINTHIN